MKVNVKETIARAIDRQDARAAGLLVDALRANAPEFWTYPKILELVQKERPAVTAAEWDELLYEADALEAEGG